MKKLTLFIDMDEVTANLSEHIRTIVNEEFDSSFPTGFNKSYWWSDYGIHRSYFKDLLNEEGMFLNLEPIEGAVEVLHKLNEEGFDIHILTCPQHNEYCYIEKVRWVQKHLPFINIETNFHTTGNKGLLAKENRVLLDDNQKYLQQWEDNGGIAVAFNQPWNHDFEGNRVYNWIEFYKKIHEPRTFTELMETIKLKECSSVNVNKYREYMKGSHHE